MTESPLNESLRELLRSDNPRETAGEWSVYDLADRCGAAPEDVALALAEIDGVTSRYVGGTSSHLYTILPPV